MPSNYLKRSLVYLPGSSELGYRVNYGKNIDYAKLAGKWDYVLNHGSFRGWADLEGLTGSWHSMIVES